MACNNQNGRTIVDTLTPVPGGTATETTYVVDLTHYTCGNRKICSNSAYPLNGTLAYRALGTPEQVGDGAYVADILITGTVSYMPYRTGNCACNGNSCSCSCNCPITENVWEKVSIPVTTATAPTLTAGSVIVSPTDMKDCCSVTNAMSIVGSFTVASA